MRRFRKNEDGDIGHLVRKLSESWAFHHDIRSDEEDDELMPYRLKTISEAKVLSLELIVSVWVRPEHSSSHRCFRVSWMSQNF